LKVIKAVLRALSLAFFPRDSVVNVEDILNSYEITATIMKLPVLLPPLACMPYYTVLCKAKYLSAIRSSAILPRVTPLARLIFSYFFKHLVHPEIRVRQAAAMNIQINGSEFPHDFHQDFVEAVTLMSDPTLDLDSLSGLAGALLCLPNIDPSIATIELLSNTALAICRPLPADTSDESVRSLRQIIILLLDQFDPYDTRLPKAEFTAARMRIADSAITKFSQYRGHRETENYAAALVCGSIVGDPVLLRPDLFSFLLPFLASDDPGLRISASRVLGTIAEFLIPRIPRFPGILVTEITPENYDSAEFIDRLTPRQASHQAKFLNYAELTDPAVLSLYWTDHIPERVAIYKLLFDQLVFDHRIISEHIRFLVDEQVTSQETFAKARLFLWSALFRLLGIDFMRWMISEVTNLTNDSATVASHMVACEIFAGYLCSLKSRPYADVAVAADLCRPFVKQIIGEMGPDFQSVWSFSLLAATTSFDPRRLFWLFDDMIAAIPQSERSRARSVAFVTEILIDVAPIIPRFRAVIEDLVRQTLFSEAALEFENTREMSVRCLAAMMSLAFDLEQRGQYPEVKRILDRFVGHANDVLITRWLLAQFEKQSTGSLAVGGYIVGRLHEFADMILDKDEHEEGITRTALMTVIGSNWLGTIAGQPPTVQLVLDFANEMLTVLLPEDRAWQVQTCLLIMAEAFLAELFFYLDECILEGLIEDRIIPALLHQHSDVQDAAAELLVFVVKSAVEFRPKLESIVEIFKRLLADRDAINRKVAGAKGLTSVILGTVLLESVPEYVVDSFQALTDAQEIDSTIERIVTQFFSDFWALHDNNLAPSVAEVLGPFHAHLRPTYFS
jgi:hypothetical protein